MGLFSSRMTPEQLAAAKGKAQSSNELHKLATEASGFGVTAVQRRKAQADLEGAVGKRKAEQLKGDAARRAGAQPKGLGRFFG